MRRTPDPRNATDQTPPVTRFGRPEPRPGCFHRRRWNPDLVESTRGAYPAFDRKPEAKRPQGCSGDRSSAGVRALFASDAAGRPGTRPEGGRLARPALAGEVGVREGGGGGDGGGAALRLAARVGASAWRWAGA